MTVRPVVGALVAAFLIACARTAESAPVTTGSDTPAAAVPPGTQKYGPDELPVVLDTALLRKADLGRIAGDSAAKVIVLEVSDFQCPYCKAFHDQTYPAVKAQYVDNGKARIAYVNLPLRSHQNAWPAAEAAMCASVQGRFWPMHDSLFLAQERWAGITKPDTMFARFARTLRIDASAYDACMSSHATRPLIASDAERSSNAGISGTPAFIIGDSLISGAYPFPDFKRVIDANLASQRR
ncbi:MAG: thioredoxin domain-containing protein [Gemmatimonadota bacterium]